jgi:type I restriction enzyme S subunit
LTVSLVLFITGSAQPKLTYEALANILIASPTDVNEIEKISYFLNQETTKIDDLIAESQNVIELLKERRSALISSAVTGKIDVRNYHA